MPKHLQIRDVPDDVHEAIRERAAEEGLSMSAYVLRELRALTGRPNRADLFRDLEGRDDGARVSLDELVAIIHEGRDGR